MKSVLSAFVFMLAVILTGSAEAAGSQKLDGPARDKAIARAAAVIKDTTLEQIEYGSNSVYSVDIGAADHAVILAGKGFGPNSEAIRTAMCFVVVLPENGRPYFIPTIGVDDLEALSCRSVKAVTFDVSRPEAKMTVTYETASPNAAGETKVSLGWSGNNKRFRLLK